MRQNPRANRVAFRRAVWASVALHVGFACALVVLLRSGAREPLQAGIDTRSEPQVSMTLADDAAGSVEVAPAPGAALAKELPPPLEPRDLSLATPDTPTPSRPAGPFATAMPQTLPPELVALVRKPAAPGAGAPNAVAIDPNVWPAGGVPTGANAGASAPGIHGALRPNQTVVYVLDCSGSMGAAGKFDAARAALVSTLKLQPATIRFQIIVYAGTARPLLASDGNPVPANEVNVRAAAEKLAVLEPRGTSNHLTAVGAAVAFHPDVILLLTDADDLSAAAFKPVLADARKPVPMRFGQVTAAGVQSLRELK